MKEIYFCSEKKINNTISEMFVSFEIHTISVEKIKKQNFKNQNIFLIVSNKLLKDLDRSFFLIIKL